ncbi:guanine nucleotide-binding protein GI/GS/GO subunit gamma-8 [Crotalus adamanteus]|uniref:Guanine nucleotide-binding protein subunit gamma n=1 Tax=Crotalus adamanteus TaxID=8729 RepID=A0AAW1AWI9_CROAD
MAKIAEARKTVEQLKLEVNIDRMKVSKAAADLLAYCEAHAKEDPLRNGCSASCCEPRGTPPQFLLPPPSFIYLNCLFQGSRLSCARSLEPSRGCAFHSPGQADVQPVQLLPSLLFLCSFFYVSPPSVYSFISLLSWGLSPNGAPPAGLPFLPRSLPVARPSHFRGFLASLRRRPPNQPFLGGAQERFGY